MMNLIPWKSKRQSRDGDDVFSQSPLALMRNEMDRMFDRFFRTDWSMIPEGLGNWPAWAPSIDVSETDKEVHVRAEVAGVDPKDLEITVRDQRLTISGQKQETRDTKDENYHRTERRFGSFRRSVELPASVDTDSVSAEHKNGVVLITLKKKPGAVARRIAVKPASD